MKKVFKFIGLFLLIVFLLVTAGLLFCALDRRSSLNAVPRHYSVYVHTDNAWSALNPLLDLQAADMLFSSGDFVQYRSAFNSIKSSDIRSNPLVKIAAGRAVDLALYQEAPNDPQQNAVAVVNLSYLSFISRLSPFIFSYVDIPGLSQRQVNLNSAGDTFNYFEYKNGDSTLYIKPLKNLVIIASSYSLLQTACFNQNSEEYTESQKKMLSRKGEGNVRIVADARRLAADMTAGNQMLSDMAKLLHKDELSVIFFTITDSDISFKCRLAVQPDPENPSSLDNILTKNSTSPELISKLGDAVQYYTMINAGTIEELKNALFPFVPAEKNAQELWNKADSYSKMLLDMDLEELLFSWTGNEFAVLGVENQNDPVVAIQIIDEEKRQKVFEKITNSMILKDDNSLIIGGVRLPQIKLPAYLNAVVSIFDINIPSPYFMVQDDYIYLSESAESLSAIYSSYDAGLELTKNNNWKSVSSQQKRNSAVSLYYNLDRSIPFFLRGKGIASKVFKLYSMGRFDGRIKDGTVEFQLQAAAAKSGNLHLVPGFPIAMEKMSSPENFCIEPGKNPSTVFWVEGDRKLKALELKSLETTTVDETENIRIIPAAKKFGNGGVLWTVSSRGNVSLYDSKLQLCNGFPVLAGGLPSTKPGATDNNLVIPLEGGKIVFVNQNGGLHCNDDIEQYQWKSQPAVYGNSVTLYAKGFEGKLFQFNGTRLINENNPVMVNGVAMGAPCVFKSGLKTYTAFITQAGNLNLWSDGDPVQEFPVKLEGVFLTNVSASSKYIYALSTEAILYRISLNGSVLSIKVPHSTAKNGYLKATEGGVYLCADANVIYGFKDNLELMNGYPLTGWGLPVFADVNGDKIDDCIAITLDKKLVAWSLR